MTINQVSKLLQLSAKTIRYYEEIGLLSPVFRSENGYRYFSEDDTNELRLIQGARNAGFSIEESKELMDLFRDQNRQSRDVKSLTTEKISQLKEKIQAMKNMLQQLEKLSDSCHGDSHSQCAILDGLSKK